MITHHPSDLTLTAYAAGALSEALAIVVATHLSFCPWCRRVGRMVEAIGGALLDELSPASMAPDALAHVLARAEQATDALPKPQLDPELPPPLNACVFYRWWPVGLGIRWRPMRTGGRAWGGLLTANPGCRLPRHGHDGLELTCVLRGSFRDNAGRYLPGDVAEPEGSHDEPPMVDSDIPCLCVIATEGVQLRGLLGVAQWVLGR